LGIIVRCACCHVLEKWARGKLPAPKNRHHSRGVEMTNRKGTHRRGSSARLDFWKPPTPSERNFGLGAGLRRSRLIMTKDNKHAQVNPLMPMVNSHSSSVQYSKKRFSSAASKNRDNRRKRRAAQKSRHVISPGFSVKRWSNFDKFARSKGLKIDTILCKNVGGTAWILYESHEHGAEYFHNRSTGEVQWGCPAEIETALRSSRNIAKSKDAVGEWVQLFDNQNHPFYCNCKSGFLAWNLPEGAITIRSRPSVQKTRVNPIADIMQTEPIVGENDHTSNEDMVMQVSNVQAELQMEVSIETDAVVNDVTVGNTGIADIDVTKQKVIWTEFQTEDGLTAYFNELTGESRWTDPNENDANATDNDLPAPKRPNKNKSLFMHSSKLAELEKQFSEYQTETGEIAFYNENTGEACWENPNAACQNFRPDLTAKQFNMCKCGFHKSAHK